LTRCGKGWHPARQQGVAADVHRFADHQPSSCRPNGQPDRPWLHVAELGLWWPPGDAAGIALLHRAIDLGYDHFDTARLYGHGHNETLVGQALKGKRDKVFLASKMGIFASGDKRGIDCHPDTIRAELEKSLTLLQTDHIDLYYMHRRDFTVPIEDSVGAMADLIQEGKIGAIGLSEMSADTLRRAAAVHPIAAMQTEYSPWTRQAEIAVIEACRDLGTTFVAFSPVARGALANGVRDPQALEEGDIRKAMPRFMADNWPRNLALVDAFNALAARGRHPGAALAGLGAGQGRTYRRHPRHRQDHPS
jgi:aryl-alcohol dehydrogenase-like predicted oxidoreductase